MKRLKVLLGLTTVLALGFTACKKKSDDTVKPDYKEPKISNLQVNNLAYTAVGFEAPNSKGDILHISFTATDDYGLKNWRLTQFVQGQAETTVKEEDLSGTSSNITYDFKISDSAIIDQSIILTIYLNDKDKSLDPETQDHSAAASYKIKVIANPKLFTKEVTNGIIFNSQSTLGAAAWDLLNDRARALSESGDNKHMINMTLANDTTTYKFKAGWASPTQASHVTNFVKVNAPTSFNYSTASEKTAHDAYLAGMAVAEVSKVAANDIYIAGISTSDGNTKYIVIKVIAVNSTTGDNNDNLTFKYKK